MKNVIFYLGPTIGLTTRQLTITQMPDANDDSYSASHDADAGATESVTVALADGKMFQAKLIDTKTTGEASKPQIIQFNTGTLQFPGPAADPTESLFRVYAMEDLSSSSSSSSQSSSSSSSSSSNSSSSSATSSSSSSSQS